MKILFYTSLLALIAWVLLALVDMWFDVVSLSVFIKLTISLCLLMFVALCMVLIKRGMASDK